MTQIELAGDGPLCPDCGVELELEPALAGHALSVAYSCGEHGVIVVASPFEAVSVRR